MAMAYVRRRMKSKTPPTVDCDGESSAGEDEDAAKQTDRGRCGQFVWPCPRQYLRDPSERMAKKWLIPSDLSKKDSGLIFKKVLTHYGHGADLDRIHVFDEPHKRYSPITRTRERHKHIVFRMKDSFAHVRIQKALAQQGMHGQFSFNLIGYVAYLRYCMVESSKKLQSDLDLTPWSWPTIDPSALLSLCNSKTPQMEARSGGGGGRKRKLMTFSEVTDVFVEGCVRTESQAWRLAKTRKMAGDDALYNTLGNHSSVSSLVSKVLKAWHDEDDAPTLCTTPDYALDKFVTPDSLHVDLQDWIDGEWRTVALILSGDGGLGKTEFACALAHRVAEAKEFHFINKGDRIRDINFRPGQALVWDEACFASRPLDDIKGIFDLKKNRDVQCRNRDGVIPKNTPRIFSTNWEWHQFFPREMYLKPTPITRRILWIDIKQDLRL